MQQKASGGTELICRALEQRLDPNIANDLEIIPSRVGELDENKIRILHLHDLPEDPMNSHLRDVNNRRKFHKIVFCGNWQYNRFIDMMGIPPDDRLVVIDNPVVSFDRTEINKSTDEIRLIYTSTPQRGLAILVPVFEELCKKHDNIVLDVFSSFSIYGWDDADKGFEKLFEACKNHPKINYHGFQPNDVDRKALSQAHIFAYPSIWPECNSRAMIESMSAETLCIHPNYAGLSDTCGSLTMMYQYDVNVNEHANKFYSILDHAITNKVMFDPTVQNIVKLTKIYADTRYDINRIATQWIALTEDLLNKYPTTESRKFPEQVFSYKV